MGSCSVYFDNAFVPDALVLGEPHKAWYMLLPTLNNERIMVGAFCLGVIDGVLEDAVDYMKQRKAFGGVIGRFQSLDRLKRAGGEWDDADAGWWVFTDSHVQMRVEPTISVMP